MSINYKFKEDKNIVEIAEYVNKTYAQHYAQDEKVQAFEVICQKGMERGLNFAIDNAMKYTWRQGFKKGQERSDILKIIHYGLLALYAYDEMTKPDEPPMFDFDSLKDIRAKPYSRNIANCGSTVNNAAIPSIDINKKTHIGNLTVHANGAITVDGDLRVSGDIVANGGNDVGC